MMRSKKVLLFLFASFLLLQPYLVLAQNQNVGFVETNIWYSKDPFEEGDKVKIYTLVFNPSAKNFKGTVAFFDKTTLLGKKDFAIPSLTAEAVFVDWTVAVGGHQIFARIENPRFEISAGKYEEVYLANDETAKSERTVAKKIPNIEEVKEKINETLDSSVKPIQDLEKKITDSLPPAIAKPVTNTFGFFEDARLRASDSVEEKRVEAKNEIEQIRESANQAETTEEDTVGSTENADSKKTENKQVPNSVQTPLKYVSLFFLTILSYVLKYKILFYLLSLVVIFMIIRLVFRMLK